MIISYSNRFVFFKPIKCAGSSIESVLSDTCSSDDIVVGSTHQGEENLIVSKNDKSETGKLILPSHATPRLVSTTRFYHKIENYDWITASRNPWDMCVSFWWWSASETSLPLRLVPNHSDDLSVTRRKFKLFLQTQMYFDDIYTRDEILVTPLEYLSSMSSDFCVDRVDFTIRFERLDEDFKELCEYLGIEDKSLPRLKSTQRKSKLHYRDYYDDILRFYVESKFSDLVSKFDYSF